MWLAVVVICLALVAVLVKYVLGTGPNPFDIDTREPPKPIVFDRKLKNKVLKQGESEIQYVLYTKVHVYTSYKLTYDRLTVRLLGQNAVSALIFPDRLHALNAFL